MKEFFSTLLIGFALGAIVTGAYYNDFVVPKYKLKLQATTNSLQQTQKQVQDKIMDISILTMSMEALKEYNNELFKNQKETN